MNKIIEKAIELAETREWTQKTYARNIYGEQVDPSSQEACSFCALGFLSRAAWEVREGPIALEQAKVLVEKCVSEDFCHNIPAFNDALGTTKHDIIKLFRKANA